MKHLKNFKIFESSISQDISITDFLIKIRIDESKIQTISDWWSQNRTGIKIHLFPFKSQRIMGVFLGVDTICINDLSFFPPHMKLFLALHESRHCDQHREGRFMSGYYDTVIAENKVGFLKAYSELEKDANDFAISSMRQCGFSREMDNEESRLRMNETMGNQVYEMMTNDIRKFNPIDFIDLLKKQIL
jgi:hypothetical protein